MYTGGTIGMVHDAVTGILSPFKFDELTRQVPELNRFSHEIDTYSFYPPIDSSNMHPCIWEQIARKIGEKYDLYDGFVILHGSDTMAYTASALSFMLEGLGKPVVLTGSQLPVGEIRTDARENLVTAIEIAASKDPVVCEVCIYFDYQLYRGNRASKYHAAKFEAFLSVNYPVLAEAGVHIRYNRNALLPYPDKPFKVNTGLDTSVALLKIFPGIHQNFVRSVLETPGIRAVVLEAFGAGNTPSDEWFLKLLRDAIQKGIVILDVTQCGGGNVELGRYETSIALKEMGVVGGYDITTEAAITKLMFLLGQGCEKEEVKRLLQTPLCGEMTIS
jgi:L-asparaginase